MCARHAGHVLRMQGERQATSRWAATHAQHADILPRGWQDERRQSWAATGGQLAPGRVERYNARMTSPSLSSMGYSRRLVACFQQTSRPVFRSNSKPCQGQTRT